MTIGEWKAIGTIYLNFSHEIFLAQLEDFSINDSLYDSI